MIYQNCNIPHANTTLTHLDMNDNRIANEEAIAIARVLTTTTTHITYRSDCENNQTTK